MQCLGIVLRSRSWKNTIPSKVARLHGIQNRKSLANNPQHLFEFKLVEVLAADLESDPFADVGSTATRLPFFPDLQPMVFVIVKGVVQGVLLSERRHTSRWTSPLPRGARARSALSSQPEQRVPGTPKGPGSFGVASGGIPGTVV